MLVPERVMTHVEATLQVMGGEYEIPVCVSQLSWSRFWETDRLPFFFRGTARFVGEKNPLEILCVYMYIHLLVLARMKCKPI